MIRSASGGTGFNVLFYGCKEHRQCADLQFQVAWDYTKNNPAAAAINQWNARKRFTKVYLDGENDPFLEMDVIFTEGRMSGAAFGEHLDLFVESMGNFEKEFRWKQDSPTPAALPAGGANHVSR
jgi:hypothetical protein